MGILSGFLSFEKSMGATLTRLMYYLGILAVIWHGLERIWRGLTIFPDYWWTATKHILYTPILMALSIIFLRIVAEYLVAHFRMDKSLHDQVTGRAAPPKAD